MNRTAQGVESDAAQAPDRGRRLLALLSLPPAARVLLHGDALPGWDHESWQARRDRDFHGQAYDLVVLDTRTAVSRAELVQWFRGVGGTLEAGGFLLVLCHNSWSPDTLRRIGSTGEGGGRAVCSAGWATRTLHRGGFPVIRRYLCFPGLRNPKDFVDPDSRFLELPARAGALYHAARRGGFLARVHPHHLLLCGGHDWQDRGLALKIRDEVAGRSDGIATGAVRITRFDIRRRGALAVFLSEGEAGRNVIGRLVSGSARGRHAARNHEFLQALRQLPALPAACRERLPSPVSTVVEGEATVYLETVLPGILAWQADWSRLGDTIQRGAVDFLEDFGQALVRSEAVDQRILGLLFDAELELIRDSRFLRRSDRERLNALLAWVAGRIEGRTLPLVYAHGDFGIGNVLVDARAGSVTGVIDWDTGREWELPGVDGLNWEIQRRRMTEALEFGPALRRVGDRLLAGGTEDAPGLHPLAGPVPRELKACILVVCGLRYVCRDLRYPEIYGKLREELVGGLDCLEAVVRHSFDGAPPP